MYESVHGADGWIGWVVEFILFVYAKVFPECLLVRSGSLGKPFACRMLQRKAEGAMTLQLSRIQTRQSGLYPR